MPITTVTKITGAVTVLISCRNASASHFASVAGPGATSPNTHAGGDRHEYPEPQLPLHGSKLLSSLHPAAPRPRDSGERTGGQTALSCLWSLWSKVSLWSREPEAWDMRRMRVRSLAGRLLVLQLTVVAVTVAAGALITVLVARERTETAARDRSLTVARTVAALPELPQALGQPDPSAALQPLAESAPHRGARQLHHDHAPGRHSLHAPDAEPDRQAIRRHVRARGARADGDGDHHGHARPLRARGRAGARERARSSRWSASACSPRRSATRSPRCCRGCSGSRR